MPDYNRRLYKPNHRIKLNNMLNERDNQYLITSNCDKLVDDLIDFIEGYNQHYKTHYDFTLYKVDPSLNGRYTALGFKKLHEVKNEKD